MQELNIRTLHNSLKNLNIKKQIEFNAGIYMMQANRLTAKK